MFRSWYRSCCAPAGAWRPREGWLRRFCKLLSSCMFPIGRARSSVATRISEVYDAFIAAGAPEEKARKAAEALADYENRFTRIDSELLILKWMVGFGIALNVAILTRLFLH